MTIDRKQLHALHERESQRFVTDHPRSAALYERAQSSLLGGVPMNWMKKWAGKSPVFVAEARGAHFAGLFQRSVSTSVIVALCAREPRRFHGTDGGNL